MTLREAVEQVQDEYDAEIKAFEIDQRMSRIAKAIMSYEYDVLNELDLIGEITGHAPIVPAESKFKIWQWVTLAFRLGMRVERKLANPNKPTTVFDISYDRPKGKS